MSDGEVRLMRGGAVATIVFDRPQARNAMTWRMYEGLAAACDRTRQRQSVSVAVLRGAGGKAFIAGTDIAQFLEFPRPSKASPTRTKMEVYLGALEALPMPTLAVVEGWAIGGGLAIAACCDLRIATPGTKFGVPIARTLGNCLSVANYARLVAVWRARTKRMMLWPRTSRRKTRWPPAFSWTSSSPPRSMTVSPRSASSSPPMRRSLCASPRRQSGACRTPACRTATISCAPPTAATTSAKV